MNRFLLSFFIICCLGAYASGLNVPSDKDIAVIDSLLGKLKVSDLSLGDRIILVAENMVGAPEDYYYSTDSTADLRINMESFSPLMFVNSVVALSKASLNPGTSDWKTFASELENISCRRGVDKGFPSIMYHTSDWIGDNSARGNLTELTENYAGAVARTKSLDEMSRKRDRFAALSDSANFEAVRMTEMGFRTHRIPSLKKETIKKKEVLDDLREGDIIILVPNRDGIDCYDIGFVTFRDKLPYLVHVSPQSHKVVMEKEDLSRYMNLMTKHFQGYRILRVRD